MVEDTQARILRALAKLRGRQESLAELGHLTRERRLADAIEDVERGVDVTTAAEELAAVLKDFAQPSEPVAVVPRETAARAANRVGVLSLLFALEAEEREDVVRYRRDRLAGELLTFEAVGDWITQRQAQEPASVDPLQYCGPDLLHYATPGDVAVRYVQTRTGVLAELRRLSESLAETYYWQPVQATIFALTGLIPVFSRVRVTVQHSYPPRPLALSRVQLSVDPFTTPRELAAAYAKVRHDLLGPRYRPVSEKHLALLAFGAEARSRTPQPRWREVRDAWNAEHAEQPTWQYANAEQLARDWRVARGRLLRPGR